MMKIVFLSNYFSHHQKTLSDELAARADYTFVATAPMTQERLALGWGSEPEPAYVCHYQQEQSRAEQALQQADAVIVGSAPEELARECILRGQLVLRYAERPLKHGSQWHKYLPRLIKWHMQNPMGKSVYLLCASAYTAGDYARFGLFRDRAFCWGYFPETRRYDSVDALLRSKKKNSILWAGRLLDWKHPDDALRAAASLKADGIDFELNIIGRGPMEAELRRIIEENGLQDNVHMLGAMTPGEVRRHMERSEIFLFTSDRREGWGAVLNEAMNSGCAVVAGDAIGAVPYLIRNEENGCVYRSGDVPELAGKVKSLLADEERRQRLGRNAYQTIVTQWNGAAAAQRLLELLEKLLAGERTPKLYADGPCSPSPIMREDWY